LLIVMAWSNLTRILRYLRLFGQHVMLELQRRAYLHERLTGCWIASGSVCMLGTGASGCGGGSVAMMVMVSESWWWR
jgi:hypothetical protein